MVAIPLGYYISNLPKSPELKLEDVPSSIAQVKTIVQEFWVAPETSTISDAAVKENVEYGKELIAHTAKYLGPNGSVKSISNGMNCQNCHLQAGTAVFGNNYGSVASLYPKFRARSGGVEDIEKVTKFLNLLIKVRDISAPNREINSVLSAIGGDSRVGKKYMRYGFGFGGPCLPRDNRALGHYANELGMKLNLPLTVDDFNKEHAEFVKNFFMNQNPDKTIPFVMNYITYKRGTDILEESQQFKLCLDLLEEGYYVNVIEIDSVVKQLSELSEEFEGRLKLVQYKCLPLFLANIKGS
jgi:hypothetical protein